ncbi:MAG: bifunctional folylpolyglutamate synthase/dihydrofolate synthase [Deltaproteobacteria bacterium]|nr:bifunctional folylpolyglutamate synthase/dihydrofolate synthase [Deltaproteobacteria bacterium]
MDFEQAMAALEGLELHGIVLGLDRVRFLLEALGNPQETFPSIHIAGTNGKGSTAVYLDSVLQRAGLRTGRYTSPHLHHFSERITLSGEKVAPEVIAARTEELLEIVRSAGPDFQPTYFEMTTAMAFAVFAEAGIDIAVVETGLGGRLDATNVIRPVVSIITNVAMEHADYLGDSLEAIAREKGGIIKEGGVTVTGVRNPKVRTILEKISDRRRGRLIRLGEEIRVEDVEVHREDGSRTFTFRGVDSSREGLIVGMRGEHQVVNAAVALGALEVLIRQGVDIPDNAVREGLREACWPGRLETVSGDPWIMVDGAHNPHAARVLQQVLENDLEYHRLILVIGILQDKDVPAIVLPLLPLADRLVLTRPQYDRGTDPVVQLEKIGRSGLEVMLAPSVPEAVDAARALYAPGDLILVTGSLYTVAEARAFLFSNASASTGRDTQEEG